jgi:murein DD-endopeptidase
VKRTVLRPAGFAPGRVALSVLLIVATASPPGAHAQTAPMRRSFDLHVPVPPTPVPIAGTSQLVYELHIANFAREPLSLQRVEVVDADRATVIAEMGAGILDRQVVAGEWSSSGGKPGASSAESSPHAIVPGMFAVLYLEIAVESTAVPHTIEHRVSYRSMGDSAGSVATVTGARTAVRSEPPVTLAPPLRGGPWVGIYDPSWVSGHRRVVYATAGRARIPGRFAIDWVQLDVDGRRARGDKDAIRNWYGYGSDVLAVADGVVATVRHDVPESATIAGHPSLPLEDGAGNYIALDLGGGRYAMYEHLAPGSIRVEPGERVTCGQVIASVGFTGHSMGPHLHFHVADANSSLDAEGMPFVLSRFDILGAYNDRDALTDVAWKPLGSSERGSRTLEMPAPNAVVDFGAGAPAHCPRS